MLLMLPVSTNVINCNPSDILHVTCFNYHPLNQYGWTSSFTIVYKDDTRIEIKHNITVETLNELITDKETTGRYRTFRELHELSGLAWHQGPQRSPQKTDFPLYADYQFLLKVLNISLPDNQ